MVRTLWRVSLFLSQDKLIFLWVTYRSSRISTTEETIGPLTEQFWLYYSVDYQNVVYRMSKMFYLLKQFTAEHKVSWQIFEYEVNNILSCDKHYSGTLKVKSFIDQRNKLRKVCFHSLLNANCTHFRSLLKGFCKELSISGNVFVWFKPKLTQGIKKNYSKRKREIQFVMFSKYIVL